MQYDFIIVGGGIVGLATSLQLKRSARAAKILVVEKEQKVATHQTGNNSGVIHSGLYYKPGSLKAKNCINGYGQLVRFCDENAIPYELCGKIVVATEQKQIPAMETLFERGCKNGLKNLKKLGKEELREYEPNVAGVAGIFVPQTGIVNYRKVCEKFAEIILKQDGQINFGEKVTDILHTSKGSVNLITDKSSYEAKMVINCAGLYSDKIARLTEKRLQVKIIPFRGEYYKLRKDKEHLVKNLIYPVPDPNFPFLGVHFTRMIEGGVEAGPNAVLAFGRESYTKSDVNIPELFESLAWPGFQKVALKYWKTGLGEMYRSFSKAAFTKALQKLLPEVQKSDLEDGGAGVRAQACDKRGGLIDDFLVLEQPGVINVCNAPSPAATSSLSIGETVAQMALERITIKKVDAII